MEVVDAATERRRRQERQTEMKSFLSGAIDVFWRLCFDMFGQRPGGGVGGEVDPDEDGVPRYVVDIEAKAAEAVRHVGFPSKNVKGKTNDATGAQSPVRSDLTNWPSSGHNRTVCFKGSVCT